MKDLSLAGREVLPEDTIDELAHQVEVGNVLDLSAVHTRESLTERFYKTKREDFKQAMDISAYSLLAMCQHGYDVLKEGTSVLTLSYLGAVRAVPGYNIMGVCKAALESTVRYLAADLGDLNKSDQRAGVAYYRL